jgi:hypothetical protein
VTIGSDRAGRWERLQPRERALIIIFAIIAALGVIYLVFVSGGGEPPEGFSTPAPTTGASVTPTPTASAAPSPTGAPETLDNFSGKDPFRPLITTGGGGGGTPAPGPTGGPTGGTNGGQRVTLVDISGSGSNRVATVEVDGTEYQVHAGDTFAGSYRVKSLTASCGTFVFGDETFTLCVGQEVLK